MSHQSDNIPGWMDVSRETESRLEALCDIVKKWTPTVNLVSKSTISNIWQRHIIDSAQVFYFAPPDARQWLDLGSGAGFPGLVIAILAAEQRKGLQVCLVESDQRKAVFLNEAARALNIPVTVICHRIETIAPRGADVVSARALTALDGLCSYAKMHLNTGGVAIFPKGANVEAEIETARKQWQFSLEVKASRTDPAASILLLRNVAHV